MRATRNKINVQSPDSDFPFGRVKNNTGTRNGTPDDEALVGDAMQFFEKLMFDSGLAMNNLPEQSYTGFQLNQALTLVIQKVVDNNTAKGVYTPTVVAIANCTNVADINQFTYLRVGNIVHITGSVHISILAANTATYFSITLPISTTMTDNSDASGTATGSAIMDDSPGSAFAGSIDFLGAVRAKPSINSHIAYVSCWNNLGGADDAVVYVSFSYVVK